MAATAMAAAAVAVNWYSTQFTRVVLGEMHVLPFAAEKPIDFCIFAHLVFILSFAHVFCRRIVCAALHFHRKRSGANGVPENGNFTNRNAR